MKLKAEKLNQTTIGLATLLAASMLLNPAAARELPKASEQAVDPTLVLIDSSKLDQVEGEAEPVASGGGFRAPTVRFRMPLLMHDWRAPTAYVDLDAGTSILDYECDTVTYNTHNGNDLAIRDFVEQDEGRFVLAAARGTVADTADGFFDRHYQWIPGSPVNGVILEHEDASETVYLHMKKWSVLVYPGQEVFKGQPIGMVGSSGMSSGPHVHFMIRQDGVVYEPNVGTCHPGASLWEDQPNHATANPVEFFHAGMTTVDPNPNGRYKFRPPDVYHVKRGPGSTDHYFWWWMKSCHAGDVTQTVYRDPSGALFDVHDLTCDQYYSFVYGRWPTALPSGGVTGTWTIDFYLNSMLQTRLSFEYDDAEYQDPVVHPRVVTVEHGVAVGDLRGSDADSGLWEFRIVTPPTHGRVALHGPRQAYFSYTPDSGYEGPDTFEVEVEDGQTQVSAAAAMTMDVSPVIANTLRLEGEADYAGVADNGTLNLTAGFTLETWVRRGVGSSYGEVLIDRRNPDETMGYSLVIGRDSRLALQVGDGTTATYAYGTTPIPMGRWTHVAGTWDGTTLRLYVDGQLEPGEVDFNGPIQYPGTYDTELGGASTSPGDSFRGEIDETRIWSVPRTAEQLRTGADCAFRTGAPPDSLRAWWRFNGDVQDDSTYGNHGALVDPAFFRSTDAALPFCAGHDTDADGFNDALDVCPLVADLSQMDTDSDGLGDVCDLCPTRYGPREADTDSDGVADACDNCPFLGNTEQPDADGDGAGDLCDPDPSDPADAVPSGDITLTAAHDQVAGMTTLSWSTEPLAGSYDLFRGSLEEIRARFYGTCQSSRDPDTTDTSFVDGETPASGELFGYLAVGVGTSGARGRSSLDSTGRIRDLRARDCL